MPRGGARQGSGPAKGAKYKPTLEKEELRQRYRARQGERLDKVTDAQFASACAIFSIGSWTNH